MQSNFFVMFKRFLFSIIFCSFTLSVAYAGVLKGTITDSLNGTPLTGVVIGIASLAMGAQTDADGYYEIPNIPQGQYEVAFKYVSFNQQSKTINIGSSDTVELNILMTPEKGTLKDVTVRSNKITNTENAVMLEIRKANVIASGVGAVQIAKTMDRSAADVVKRIPGVSIIDDRFIMVRGLYDRYNTTWLNDVGAPSAELDKKSFSFDLVPSGQIDRILIFKTPSPELPGDFAGGMVKLYTSSLPDNNQVSAGMQLSYREHSTGTTFNYNPRGKTDWLGYDDGHRSIPEGLPTVINRNDANIADITKSFKNNWQLAQKQQPLDTRFNVSVATTAGGSKVKFGNLFGLTYSNIATNYEITRKYFEIDTTQHYHYNDMESVNKATIGIMENLAVSFGRSRIDFRNLYNQTGRAAATIRRSQQFDTINNPVADELAYISNYQSVATYAGQLSGTHNSANDKRKYNWTLGYTDLFKNMPDYMRTKYTKNYGAPDSMFRMNIPSGYVDPINGGGRFYSRLSEKIYAFTHNFSQKISLKNYEFEVNAGNYFEYKERTFNARLFGYVIQRDPNNPAQADSIMRLPINDIFNENLVGGKYTPIIEDFADPASNYKGQNRLIASYVSLTLPIGQKFKLVAGARHEDNIQSVLGYQVDSTSISYDVKTSYVLPSLNIAYNFNAKSLVRAAYGMTLNRPEFRELAPFYFYDNEEVAGMYGSLYSNLFSGEQGKFLKVAEIQNVDVRYEWYPNPGEMVQAGVFYKQFKNPIQRVLIDQGSDQRDFTFVNCESAQVYGVEIDARKNLDFADAWFSSNLFKDFTVVANASFIQSNMKYGSEAFSGDTSKANEPETRLQGQSPYVINGGLYYQNNDNGLKGSILYNVFGPRIFALGIAQVPDLYETPFQSLDIAIEKTFFKHYTLSMGVQNLLDGKMRVAYDFDRNSKIDANESDKAWRYYKPGKYFSLGVKVRF